MKINSSGLKEERFGTVFMLSILWLFPLSYASPYVTAKGWADCILYIAIGLGIYDLLYLFFLRRKEGVSFGRALARVFLYFFLVVIAIMLWEFAFLFFDGFTPSDFVGNTTGPRVYGFDAIISDGWGNLFRIPVITISTLYCFLYVLISKMMKRRHIKIQFNRKS